MASANQSPRQTKAVEYSENSESLSMETEVSEPLETIRARNGANSQQMIAEIIRTIGANTCPTENACERVDAREYTSWKIPDTNQDLDNGRKLHDILIY